MSAIEIRQLRSEDREGVGEMMPHFLRNEPITKTVLDNNTLPGFDVNRESKTYLDATFSSFVNDGVSVVAVDTATGNYVGYRLSAIVHKDKPEVLPFSKDDSATRYIALCLEALANIHIGIDIFGKYKVDKYVSFRGVFVSDKYQRQGIGGKMVQKSLDLCKAKNIGVVAVEASSAFSSKIFENLGFEKLVEQNFADSFRFDGKLLPMSEELKYHKQFTLYVKVL